MEMMLPSFFRCSENTRFQVTSSEFVHIRFRQSGVISEFIPKIGLFGISSGV